MNGNWRKACLACMPVVIMAAWGARGMAQLQIFPTDNEFELSEKIQLDQADSTVLAQLERVKAFLADKQWDEAVETLRELMAVADGKVIAVTDRRYVNLRDRIHLNIASLPPEALKLYRDRIDPAAKLWYEKGIADRDRVSLEKVVEQAFASSYGDDALLALGEIALESGDYAAARWYWERILPVELPAGVPRTWPGYPDTNLDVAAVRARLVLVSILEGATARARDELTQFARLHPNATGRFGGRESNYAEALTTMLAESESWPTAKPSTNWPTFAGSPPRNTTARPLVDVGKVSWRLPLRKVLPPPAMIVGPADVLPFGGENASGLLSYHPVLQGNLLLVNDRLSIKAVDVRTGKAAWGHDDLNVYRDELDEVLSAAHNPPGTVNVPRFTMTVFGDKLFARMGAAITSRPQRSTSLEKMGYLVCLDLASEGRTLWTSSPENGWAFEGSPVSDGKYVFVGMRRSDIRPQAFVACLDAQTGKPRWRSFVCGAETPARGMVHECTHNLLTMVGDTLYYNTNLGAVAAISARSGQVKWISLYPRTRRGDISKLDRHWRRDLNPCVFDRGRLFVAPADSPRVFAFDAGTGQILWQSGSELGDVTDLLGTADGKLIASGDKLYWIGIDGADAGRVKHAWPGGAEDIGFGRGIIAGQDVLWPTRETVYVFDKSTGQQKKAIELRSRGAGGGNLLIVDGRLIIAGEEELIGMGIRGGVPNQNTNTVTLNSQ